jgi:hypothetical protein
MTTPPLKLTGQLVTFEWRIEDLGTHDPRTGLRQCVVHEIYRGDDVPDPQKFGPMPCIVAENFVIIRRQQAQEMMSEGGHIKHLLN